MAVSDLYDSFFVDTDKEFRYVGCQDKAKIAELQKLIDDAMAYLYEKNNGEYDTSNHTFKPDGNAEYVRMIFKMYASGKSAADILKRLHGIKNNKGKPFTVNGIMSILHNEIYVGDKQFGKRKSRNVITGEVDEIQAEGYVKDHHKGLVDRKTWERVQERLGKKHSSPSDQKGMEGLDGRGEPVGLEQGSVE